MRNVHPTIAAALAPFAPPGSYAPAVDRKPLDKMLDDMDRLVVTGPPLTDPAALGGYHPTRAERLQHHGEEREEPERFDEATGPML